MTPKQINSIAEGFSHFGGTDLPNLLNEIAVDLQIALARMEAYRLYHDNVAKWRAQPSYAVQHCKTGSGDRTVFFSDIRMADWEEELQTALRDINNRRLPSDEQAAG